MSEAMSQWVTVGEAAGVSGVSERTVWRWVRDGIVESRHEKRGQQSTRLVNAESLPDGESASGPVRASSEAVRRNGTGCPDTAEADGESQSPRGASHESAPGVSPVDSSRAELLAALQREREMLQAHVETLTQQLEIRNRAEEQLRMMMAHLERTNAELAASLCQKALPPAAEVIEPPKAKVRWYWPWRRV